MRMCDACERDDHMNCGMQTWCECECDPEQAAYLACFEVDPYQTEHESCCENGSAKTMTQRRDSARESSRTESTLSVGRARPARGYRLVGPFEPEQFEDTAMDPVRVQIGMKEYAVPVGHDAFQEVCLDQCYSSDGGATWRDLQQFHLWPDHAKRACASEASAYWFLRSIMDTSVGAAEQVGYTARAKDWSLLGGLSEMVGDQLTKERAACGRS